MNLCIDNAPYKKKENLKKSMPLSMSRAALVNRKKFAARVYSIAFVSWTVDEKMTDTSYAIRAIAVM